MGPGIGGPTSCQAMPAAQARISGLVATLLRTMRAVAPGPAWRVSTTTDSVLTTGTMAAKATAASVVPVAP